MKGEAAKKPDALCEAFLAALSARGGSPGTVKAYRRDLRTVARVARLCREHGGQAARAGNAAGWEEMTPALLDSVFSSPDIRLTAKGERSPASLHRMKAAVRAFFNWAVETGTLKQNPARSLKTKRLAGNAPEFLSDAERKRLLKELKGRSGFINLRDRVMIEVLLGTGIRVGELCALNIDDLDSEYKHLRIIAKGGTVQTRFIKTNLRGLLRRYLNERTRRDRGGCGAMFLSSRGTRLCVRQISGRIGYWFGKAGIEKKVSPHSLRHTFATNLYEATGDIYVVQKALGHRDAATTQIYTHLADERLAEALERI